MIYIVTSVRDIRAQVFMPPVCETSEATAIRNFAYGINNSGIMNFAPKDFDLWKIGKFDTEKGTIEPEKVPVIITSGMDVIQND